MFAVYYFPWIHVRIFAVYEILVFCIWFFATRFSGCYEIWLSHRQNNIFLINDWSSIPCIIFHKYVDFSCLQNFGVLLWDINSSDQEEWLELASELMNAWNMILLSLPSIFFHKCADFYCFAMRLSSHCEIWLSHQCADFCWFAQRLSRHYGI